MSANILDVGTCVSIYSGGSAYILDVCTCQHCSALDLSGQMTEIFQLNCVS